MYEFAQARKKQMDKYHECESENELDIELNG